MSGEEPDLKLVEQVRRRLAGLARDWTPMDVAHAILDCGRVASDKTVLAVVEELRRTSTGAGRLDPLLAMDGVTASSSTVPTRCLSTADKAWN